jgi:hypothetical protein
MNVINIDIAYMIYGKPELNQTVVSSEDLRLLLAAGYLATNVSQGRFEVLRGIVTFDQGFWSLLVCLVQHYGVDEKTLETYMLKCGDAVQFRLLAKLVGELRLSHCAGVLCQRLLDSPSLDRQFDELRQLATPIRQLVTEALGSMPPSVLPILETYLSKAKAKKRWKAKQSIEVAIKSLKARSNH